MNMKTNKLILLAGVSSLLLFSNCATIIGGSKYYAHIEVKDNKKAKVFYQNREVGEGHAIVYVKRSDIDKFKFTLKQEGCASQEYKFVSRTFRGWAFAGTLIGWTGAVNGIPLPWGVAVDLATGALWKPNVNEAGINKYDYKNFSYTVTYDGCVSKTKEQLLDVVYLKNGSIIKGTILEQIPSVSLKIKTKDENVLVFKMEEIEKIVKE